MIQTLDIDKDCVMVLQGVGPVGYPGMPEVGNMTLPKKLLDEGVTDMVRISDGRMSGTAYGTVVLHVAPESAVGGTLALVQNGDMISLDVAKRSLQLEVSDEELAKRKKEWSPPKPQAERGYTKMYIENVNQADKGCDLKFLIGGSGAEVNRDLHQSMLSFLLLFIAIVFIILLTSRFQWHPFIALLIVSLGYGFAVGLSTEELIQSLQDGFGATLGSIGMIIVAGLIIGTFVEESGGAHVIANFFVKIFGSKRIHWAIGCMGYLISIPVFADSGFVILTP